MNGKIRLRPAASLTQDADALPEPNADFGCHKYSIAVFFRLHIAYRIQTLRTLAGNFWLDQDSGSGRTDLDDETP
jgi:hypothetical protein